MEGIWRAGNYIRNLLYSGDARSVKAKRNILASFLFRALSIAVSFYTVTITLNYLSASSYGIWLTLTSFVSWFSFFDIGLGNGLRNKLTEAIAKGHYKQAKIFVSTTYALLAIIIFSFLVLFLSIYPFVDWIRVFNAPNDLKHDVSILVMVVFVFFSLQMLFNLINAVLLANQDPAINGLIGVSSNMLSLFLIILLTKISRGSLLYFGISLAVSSLVILIVANFFLFRLKYRNISPSFRFVCFRYSKELLGLGSRFFIIQLSVLVLFSTDNMIIAQLFGPAEVIPYNIAFKYFGVVTMAFSIIISPMWSAITEAYVNQDIKWIETTIRRLIRIWRMFVVLGIVLLIFSPFFYRFWIGNAVFIPFKLSLTMLIYACIFNWGNIFIVFINGSGKIMLQLYASVTALILNIPLSIFLAKGVGLGTAGVILATSFCIFFGPILAPFQYRKIISGTATGIWGK